MGITLKTVDQKSSIRKIDYQFNLTATNNSMFVHIPFACKYDKAIFGRALASAGLVIDISNMSNSSTIVSGGSTAANISGAIGSIGSLSAVADAYISANSILSVVASGTTDSNIGSLCLIFSLDDNKEK